MVESALSAATVGTLHAATTKPVILLEGDAHSFAVLDDSVLRVCPLLGL